MTTDPARGYRPPDPTLVEDKPEAHATGRAPWKPKRTDPPRRAQGRPGPGEGKQELGIGGVG